MRHYVQSLACLIVGAILSSRGAGAQTFTLARSGAAVSGTVPTPKQSDFPAE